MNDVPQGWRDVEVRDVAELIRGVSYRGDEASKEPREGFVPLLRATNIADALLLDFDLTYVSRAVVAENQMLAPGDILIAASSGSRPVVGKSAPLRKHWDGTFGAFCAVLRPRSVEPRFLAYRVSAADVRKRWSNAAAGTNINNLKRDHILETPVQLPPFEEQGRIVEAIDRLFSRLDAAGSPLRQAQIHAKQLQMRALENAINPTWPLVQFGEIVHLLRNGIFVSRPAKEPPGLRILRISAVRPMRLDLHDVRYASLPADEARDYFIHTGDLLFTRYSGNPSFVGSCAVVHDSSQPTLHPDKLIRVVVDQKKALPEFVSLVLNNGAGRKQIEQRLKTTAGQVGIAGSQLRSVTIPLPSLSEQRRAVDHVSSVLSRQESSDAAVQRARQRAFQLRRSILELAFIGKLVPQDPRDEPVSLPRISVNGDARTGNGAARRQTSTASQALSSLE